MSFVEFNPNPRKLKTSDCTVRALCVAYGISWLEALDYLIIARKEYRVPSDIENVKQFIESMHHIKIDVKVERDGKRKRLSVKDVSLMSGTYIVQVAQHLVCVKNNNYYDTFDCGEKKAYRIWKVKP